MNPEPPTRCLESKVEDRGVKKYGVLTKLHDAIVHLQPFPSFLAPEPMQVDRCIRQHRTIDRLKAQAQIEARPNAGYFARLPHVIASQLVH